MPTLTIDNQRVTVPDGSNVLEAAQQLGIVIPHFCYHAALGSVGACRLCAMTFVEGPVKGVQMACMVAAQEGMVVSTTDAAAVEQRAHVIEWLMMHHPHDCPVCDEGGECQLQDMTIAGGHGLRRYRGRKRTWHNQELGPFIVQEMNRCIQCYRCVRTYQDYCGGTDFGVLGSRDRLFFGRFRDGRLESPFAGNLVDVCPTGVFTDKTYRFRSRSWDLQEAASVCPHCSLGCAAIPGARYRELQRVRAGHHPAVNGHFLCDRGRFGYGHANHPERPRVPRLPQRGEVGWDETLAAVKARVQALVADHGRGSVAFLGSPRASLEANLLLARWAREVGGPVAFEPHPGRDHAARQAAAAIDRAASLAEIRGADLVILAGVDPLHEGPLLALAVRQAVRQGAHVAVLDPRPVQLPCAAAHLTLAPERIPSALRWLGGAADTACSRQEQVFLEGLALRLRDARRPVLVGGGDLLGAAGMAALNQAAAHHTTPERCCRVAAVLAGPNSLGAALLSGTGPDADELLAGMQAGRIRALVCLENDPFDDHPDPARAAPALGRLVWLAVLDAAPTLATRRADAFLPVAVPAESSGTFVNNEGRLRPFAAVFSPGLPLEAVSSGDHPPRVFTAATPGGLPRPSWEVLAELLALPGDLATLRRWLADADPRFAPLADPAAPAEGARLSPGPALPPPAAAAPVSGLALRAVEAFAGSELYSSLSAPLAPLVPAPQVLVSAADAAAAGVADGSRARLQTPRGEAEVAVKVIATLPAGTLFVPRLRGTPLEIFVPGGDPIPCRLEGASEG